MMYDPKTGKGYKANKEADHLRMKKMGYSHDKPKTEAVQVDELSKKTMGSYIKRATSDNAVNNMAKGMRLPLSTCHTICSAIQMTAVSCTLLSQQQKSQIDLLLYLPQILQT